VEKRLLLEGLVELLVWLSQSDVQHRDEGLLDARSTLMESQREVATRQRRENGREQSRVELTDVRN